MSTITFEMIEAAVPPDQYVAAADADDPRGAAYENAANHAVKVYLAAARRSPVRFKKALDRYRSKEDSGQSLDALLTAEERAIVLEGRWGLTGFQWGWAINTVAYLLEQPSVPNPAIIILGEE